MGVYDVPPQALIESVATDLEKAFEAPGFTTYAKSGVSRERAPMQTNWFHLRSASVLYRIYKDGPLGTETLRTYYGGKKNRGRKPEHFKKSSGKVIRVCLQSLEKLGYVKREKKGRAMTPAGQKYLAGKAREVEKTLKLERPVKKREPEANAGEFERKDGAAVAGVKPVVAGAGVKPAERAPAAKPVARAPEGKAGTVAQEGKPVEKAEAKPMPPGAAPEKRDA